MVPLCCPTTHELLEPDGDALVARSSGVRYPVVLGVPVLLPGVAERQRLVEVNWETSGSEAGSRLAFYNFKKNNLLHARENPQRQALQAVLPQMLCKGPTLEIGSGGGGMQGIGDPYVALDYGLTALQDLIDPQYQRVCGTAEALPFPTASFAFVFSIAALEHVPRADLAFAEIDRILMPGGLAFLDPAWHCRQYICDGLTVLPYHELSFRRKIAKAMLPLTDHMLVRAAHTIPRRMARRALWALRGRQPTEFRWKRLRPDYSSPLCADCDASSSLDSHEGCLFFHSRKYEVLAPGKNAKAQLLARHVSLIVRKPAAV